MTTFSVQPDATTGKDNQVNSVTGTFNNGVNVTLIGGVTSKGLLWFDCSSIPSDATCDDATLYLYQRASGASSAFTVTVWQVASGNAAWAEGTRNNAQALSGESCWNALAANGSGGVTTAWAGSAGLATSGTDYESSSLGSLSGNRSDANGTEYSAALTASRVEGWFGGSNTNYGLLLTTNAALGGLASSDHATAGERPKLVINYTEAGGGGYTLAAEAGTHTLSGQNATLRVARLLAAGLGTHTVGGQNAGLLAARRIVADVGSYTLSGQTALLQAARRIVAATGAYTLSGQSVGFLASRLLTAAQGSYVLSGQDASLVYTPSGGPDYTLVAGTGVYTLSGQTAELLANRILVAETGIYALTGQAAQTLVNRLLTAQPGNYTLSGQAANLLATRRLVAGQGAYTLSGQAVTLVWSGSSAPVTPLDRVFVVVAEDRIFVIVDDDRTYTVD